jgi:hypothetical protein
MENPNPKVRFSRNGLSKWAQLNIKPEPKPVALAARAPQVLVLVLYLIAPSYLSSFYYK